MTEDQDYWEHHYGVDRLETGDWHMKEFCELMFAVVFGTVLFVTLLIGFWVIAY